MPAAGAVEQLVDQVLQVSKGGRSWVDVAVPAALVAGTAATRLPNLSTPPAFVFDEIYYAPDRGIDRAQRGRTGWHRPSARREVVDLGGLRIFGFTPFGWRFAALVAGCMIVLLTYLTARQLVRGHLIPALAGAAVALDGVSFTTGRVAMLDVFLALFTTAAIACTVMALRHPDSPRRVRWCKWGAAISLGLGLTVKWSALYLLIAVVLAFLWLNGRNPKGRRRFRAVVATVAILTLAPAAVYALSYVPWIVHADKTYQHITDCRRDSDCSLVGQSRPPAHRGSAPRLRVPDHEQAGHQQQRRPRVAVDQPASPHHDVPDDVLGRLQPRARRSRRERVQRCGQRQGHGHHRRGQSGRVVRRARRRRGAARVDRLATERAAPVPASRRERTSGCSGPRTTDTRTASTWRRSSRSSRCGSPSSSRSDGSAGSHPCSRCCSSPRSVLLPDLGGSADDP